MTYYLIHGSVGDYRRYYPSYCIVYEVFNLHYYVSMKSDNNHIPKQWFSSPMELRHYNSKIDSRTKHLITKTHWIYRQKVIEDNIVVGYGSNHFGIVTTFENISELHNIVDREITAWELAK